MTTMVCFSASGAAYCLPVSATRAVLRSSSMIPLPEARPHVAGIIPGEPPLTVTSALGTGGTHIIVVSSGDQTFGLQVDQVTGLRRVDDADIHPAPSGQRAELISGTINAWGGLVMVTDADALAAGL